MDIVFQNEWQVLPGTPFPLDATYSNKGVNFSVYLAEESLKREN
jgi:hypothetical protein